MVGFRVRSGSPRARKLRLGAQREGLRLKVEAYESALKRSNRAKYGGGGVRRRPRAKRSTKARSTNAHPWIRELRASARRLFGPSKHVGDERSRS